MSSPATLCKDGMWLIKQENTVGIGWKRDVSELFIVMGFFVESESGPCLLSGQYNFKDFCGPLFLLVKVGFVGLF